MDLISTTSTCPKSRSQSTAWRSRRTSSQSSRCPAASRGRPAPRPRVCRCAAWTPPMTTLSVSCMLSIAVASFRAGRPVGKGGHNSDEALSQAGSYQVTRRPTRPPRLMSSPRRAARADRSPATTPAASVDSRSDSISAPTRSSLFDGDLEIWGSEAEIRDRVLEEGQQCGVPGRVPAPN